MKPKPYKFCLNCGKRLKPEKDTMTGKLSKYLFRCKCMKKGLVVSVG